MSKGVFMMIEVSIDENEVRKLALEKVEEHLKKMDQELTFWNRKELVRRTCLSWSTIQKEFLYHPDFPRRKVGTKWLFPADKTKEFLLNWLEEAGKMNWFTCNLLLLYKKEYPFYLSNKNEKGGILVDKYNLYVTYVNGTKEVIEDHVVESDAELANMLHAAHNGWLQLEGRFLNLNNIMKIDLIEQRKQSYDETDPLVYSWM